MASRSIAAPVAVRACAKINVTLRVTGVRADGYHELRTVFQSVELHDTLILAAAPGPFRIECGDPACPTDRSNLVWRAAHALWRAARRRGLPRDVVVRIVKRIPLRAGLGGGSSDAAATLRALCRLWRLAPTREALRVIAASIGADVPFFLEGGTSLGLDRGDLLFPLEEGPRQWVTLVMPPFGVSTKEAFGWFDADPSARSPRTLIGGQPARRGALPQAEYRNDLQPAVAARHPDIDRMVRGLLKHGAAHAAMSGSGSTVFGLFEAKGQAERAAARLNGRGRRTLVTRTVTRARHLSFGAPRLYKGIS
jgi:4-diphosphocytidyl-2-C-methyl-D-erythritol kinase